MPVIFAASSVLILFVPCLLMGATLPLASEGCQRQLGFRNPRMLGLLFAVNTLGSVLGAAAASFELIPRWGFTATMILGVGLNAGAGIALILVAVMRPDRAAETGESAGDKPQLTVRVAEQVFRPEILMFSLGFCSLGYQMVLYRLFALERQPLPHVFAMVLTGFLLLWSIGAAASSMRITVTIRKALNLLVPSMLIPLVSFYSWLALVTRMVPRESPLTPVLAFGGLVVGLYLCLTPCLIFGYLFARVTSSAAVDWGRDVGRLYAWNTVGSCLGVLLVTLLGYRLHLVLLLIALALAVVAARSYATVVESNRSAPSNSSSGGWKYSLAGLAVLLVTGFSIDLSTALTGSRLRMFFSPTGVVSIDSNGDFNWDGLWHSRLSNGRDHIGSNNWRMATSPVVAHTTGRIRNVCVVGLGSGITATTLAMLNTVEVVDTYEINRSLADVFSDYESGTLGGLSNPKVNIVWQDARTGLALNEKKYDVVVTQPLYLKQSGSGLLNSREFLELVKSRLAVNGVFCLYSNGTDAQKLAVRETAASVFPYGETFYDGYLLVLSRQPIRVDGESIENRFGRFRDDPLWDEIRGFELTQDAKAVLSQLDRPRLSWDAHGLLVTDDHPVIEYPAKLEQMLAERGER